MPPPDIQAVSLLVRPVVVRLQIAAIQLLQRHVQHDVRGIGRLVDPDCGLVVAARLTRVDKRELDRMARDVIVAAGDPDAAARPRLRRPRRRQRAR